LKLTLKLSNSKLLLI